MRYALRNGNVITQVFDFPDSLDIEEHAPGAFPVSEEVRPGEHYWLDGDVITIPPTPGVPYKFSYELLQWVDPRSLADIKLEQRACINASRDIAEFSVFGFRGVLYDCDAVSRTRIIGAVTMASISLQEGIPYEITWATADNSAVLLDAPSVLTLGITMGQFTARVHTYSRMLKDRIDACTTKEEVSIINWDNDEFNSVFVKGKQLRAQIELAESIDDVEKIVWG